MTGRGLGPVISSTGEQTIEQGNEWRTRDESPQRSIWFEEPKLDVECGECDQEGIDDPVCSGVRRGLGVGNHEKREDQ